METRFEERTLVSLNQGMRRQGKSIGRSGSYVSKTIVESQQAWAHEEGKVKEDFESLQ